MSDALFAYKKENGTARAWPGGRPRTSGFRAVVKVAFTRS
jgi:hypothetical protein